VSRALPLLPAAANLVRLLSVVIVLNGCARVDFAQSLAGTNQLAAGFTQGNLTLAETEEQKRELSRLADEILKKPVSQSDAVHLALINSPGVQAMLARNRAEAATAARSGRIANPVFSFERLHSINEIEFSTLLAFGLLDLLTLPQRYDMAQRKIEQSRLQLSGAVIDHVTRVRQAWVVAVAARQSLFYAGQVKDAAESSAELARLLQSVGNFTTLQRARQQSFYADATTQYAAAQYSATAAQEELVRMLGLSDLQAEKLLLPDRLPDLPGEPRPPEEVSATGSAARLDIRLARSAYEAAAEAQGLTTLTSFTCRSSTGATQSARQ